MGPPDPSRLYSVSGTIDPGGQNGGPFVETLGGSTRLQHFGRFTRTTMPEQLRAAGVSWKVYASPDGNYGDNVLAYVRAPARSADLRRERDAVLPALTCNPAAWAPTALFVTS